MWWRAQSGVGLFALARATLQQYPSQEWLVSEDVRKFLVAFMVDDAWMWKLSMTPAVDLAVRHHAQNCGLTIAATSRLACG